MLELIFQGFTEWIYGMILEVWQFFTSKMLDIMSLDFDYLRSHIPIMDDIMQVLLAVGWALLLGNLVFQAVKSMASGLGFEGEDPKLLFTRTFVFSFLLLASPQICRIGLNMTSTIIDLLKIPDAVNVQLVDKSIFGEMNAAWLLVIIFDIILMFKVLKLLVEIAERYVILAVLTITAPLAFAMGGSRNTSDIFTGWCRMFASMCLLMCTNIIFFKMLISVAATVPSGLDVFAWFILILAIVKVAKKADSIITRIGLNPAITGDGLGSRLPGMLAYTVIRSAASTVSKSMSKSGGSTPKGKAPNGPPNSGAPKPAGPVGGKTGPGGQAKASAAAGRNTNQTSATATNNAASSQQTSSQQTNTQHAGSTAANSQTNSARQSAQSTALVQQNSAGQQKPAQQQKAAKERSIGVKAGNGNKPRQNMPQTAQQQAAHKSAVPDGAKRGTSYVESRQAANAEKTALERAAVPAGKQNPASPGKQSPGTAGKQSAAAPEIPGKNTRGGDSTRFSHVSGQKTQGGSVNNNVRAAEQSSVSVGQTTTATGGVGPGTAGTAPSLKPAADRTDTHSSQRSHSTHTAVTPVQGTPGQPGTAGKPGTTQTSMQGAKAETRHGRNAAPASASAPVVRNASNPTQQEPRSGRSANAPAPKQQRPEPARQEKQPRPTAGASAQHGTASTRRPGTAGTAGQASRVEQNRQAAQRQSTRSPSVPTATDNRNGKKTASTATMVAKQQSVKPQPQKQQAGGKTKNRSTKAKVKGDGGNG